MKKVATILAEQFRSWGVSHVFGIPGKAVVPLAVEIDKAGLSFVASRHECGAGYEATGFSLLSEKLGVAVGTSGPGGTNLITAAGQAMASHIPLLIITGHPSMSDTGKALGQDSTAFGTDVVEMFKPVTKFSARIERSDLVESYVRHALEKAFIGIKGPVHLSIPADVLLAEIESFQLDLPKEQHVISPNLEEVIDLLEQAERPLLFLGKGVHSSKAYEEVQVFAETWNIPVITTPGGKGSFVSQHSLSLGAFGLGGHEQAHSYLEEGVDVMVVMGTKLSDMSVAGLSEEHFPEKVIQFDYDPMFVGKTITVPTLFIYGDLKMNVATLLQKKGIEVLQRQEIVGVESVEHLGYRKLELHDFPFSDEWQRSAVQTKEEHFFHEDAASEESGQALALKEREQEFMSSAHALTILDNYLPANTIMFGDAGSHSFYAIKHYGIKKHGTFFFDDVFGAMGHAIGYSIGAKLAAPEVPIVCLTGDGCFMMHGTELSTAVNAGSNVLFIILNNEGLDMVDKGMKAHVGRSVGTMLDHPVDIQQFAHSFGANAYKCRTEEELTFALNQVITAEFSEPNVIEVIVDTNEIPPTMRRG
ncbi:thiamine pyrophosphate-binding protein [Halalkalibacter sp. AB-rgal2]|uniref:thiamine pyrophosphate-binding protein n=1 Tax=Halalkalibacter sp. AB-rgal2 TaxID=3242695 RepID=UPI00359CFB75